MAHWAGNNRYPPLPVLVPEQPVDVRGVGGIQSLGEVKFTGVQDDAAVVARDQVHGRSELSCTRQSGLDFVSWMGRHVHSSARIVAFFSSIRSRRSGSKSVVSEPNGMAGIAQ